MRFRVVAAGALAFAATTCLAAGAWEKARSGYDGFFLGADTSHIERMIDRLGENGFNAIDVKIQQVGKFDLAAHKGEVKALIDRAKAKGLGFNVYLYPIPGRPERQAVPPEEAATWKRLFAHAYQFARLHRELGFDSLRFDIETINSYETVDAAKQARINAAVKEFLDSLRAIDPDLVLGFMPAGHEPFSEAFERSVATDRLPGVIDSWRLYNGSGYTPQVKAFCERMRTVHPNNRVVVWLRPNSYYAKDIACSAYHTLVNSDGYSMWSLAMLDDSLRGKRHASLDLPDGAKGADYFAEFRRANEAFLSGREIPLRPVTQVVPPLALEKVVYPKAGVLPRRSGKFRGLMLRGIESVFIPARKGDVIRTRVRHAAGSRRPTAVHHALLGPDRKPLFDEAVSAGSTMKFDIPAASDGVYALVLSGGEGGQAWYFVEIDGLAWYVDASRRGVELFGPQSVRVFGSDRGNPSVGVENGSTQAYRLSVNGGTPVDSVGVVKNRFDLPAGMVRLDFTKHPSPTHYCQDFLLTFPNGATQYVSPVEAD